MKTPPPTVLYFASGNAHKVAEMGGLAARDGLGLEIVSARALGGMPSVVEDTGSFVGNARKKSPGAAIPRTTGELGTGR